VTLNHQHLHQQSVHFHHLIKKLKSSQRFHHSKQNNHRMEGEDEGFNQGSRLFSKVGGDKNSAESLRILVESVSYDFPVETEQRILHSSTSSEILLIKTVSIRLSARKMANSA